MARVCGPDQQLVNFVRRGGAAEQDPWTPPPAPVNDTVGWK
jgi:hypothetical protein